MAAFSSGKNKEVGEKKVNKEVWKKEWEAGTERRPCKGYGEIKLWYVLKRRLECCPPNLHGITAQKILISMPSIMRV
jgi:hypothetical protein